MPTSKTCNLMTEKGKIEITRGLERVGKYLTRDQIPVAEPEKRLLCRLSHRLGLESVSQFLCDHPLVDPPRLQQPDDGRFRSVQGHNVLEENPEDD